MQGEVPDNEVIDYVRMPRIVKKCPFKVPEVRRATEGTSASTPPSDCSDTVNVVREPARKTPSAEPSPPSPPVEDRRSGAAMINKAAPSNYEASRGHSPVTRHEVERPVGDGARPSVEPTPRPTPAEIHAAASSEAPQTSPMNPVRQRPTPTKQKKMSASNRKKSTSAHARPSQVRAASSGVAQSDRRPSSPSPLAQTQRESVTSRKAPPPTCRRENSSSGTDLDELHNEDFVTDHLESARRKPPVPKQRAKTTAKSTSTALARLEDVEGDAGDGAGKRAYEPDLTVEERMARIRERNEERQNARQLKELRKQGVAKRPQTLVRTKYGPLKAITFSGATGNSRPLAIANEAYEGPEQPAGSSSAEVSPTAAESRRSTRAPDAAASGTHNSDRKAAVRMSGSASSITSEPAGRPRMEEIIEDDIADPRRDAVAARVVHVDPVGVPKLEIDLDDDEDEDG